MIDKIAGLVNADSRLVRRGRFVDTTFMIAIDDACTLLRIEHGRVTKVTTGPFITPDYSFCLRASRSAWEKFWQPLPPLGYTDIFALVKQKLMRVEGNLHPFMANLLYLRDVMAARRRERPRCPPVSTRSPAVTCILSCSASHTAFTSRKRARAFRCSACTPRVPTHASIAAYSMMRG